MVEAFFDLISRRLVDGRRRQDLGLRQLPDPRARRRGPGRNPRTGEAIPIKARRVVTFHASHKLKGSRAGRHAGRQTSFE